MEASVERDQLRTDFPYFVRRRDVKQILEGVEDRQITAMVEAGLIRQIKFQGTKRAYYLRDEVIALRVGTEGKGAENGE